MVFGRKVKADIEAYNLSGGLANELRKRVEEDLRKQTESEMKNQG
jgi:hypothetical protein